MIEKNYIEKLVQDKLEGTAYFMVDCSVSKDNQIVVVLDGEKDVSIDACMNVSRYLESSLDRDREDFELQVTSYGTDMPLVNMRQYRKYLNRPIKILDKEDKLTEGILLEVDDEKLRLEPQIKPKKKGMKPKKGEPLEFRFSEIKEIKPVLKF